MIHNICKFCNKTFYFHKCEICSYYECPNSCERIGATFRNDMRGSKDCFSYSISLFKEKIDIHNYIENNDKYYHVIYDNKLLLAIIPGYYIDNINKLMTYLLFI